MELLHIGNRDVVLDDDGFLDDENSWDELVAEEIAKKEGLGRLDEQKMKIISAMREHYLKFASWPILAKICKISGNGRRDCLEQEFGNPMLAWKIAGLPKPPNIFFSCLDGEHYTANPVY
jgi:tRNA 2-thiouridine synthesizing protein E